MNTNKENIIIEDYILNENNKYLDPDVIKSILRRYKSKHKIKDINIFQQALIHPSYVLKEIKPDRIIKLVNEKGIKPLPKKAKAIPLQKESYERLEFLGDSVIHLTLADYLFKRYNDQDQGFMTRLRTKLENCETLAELAKKLNLHEWVIIGRYVEQAATRDKNNSIYEDVFESFIGALYIESSFETCYDFIINVIESELDFSELLHVETNYKDSLVQYYHRMKWPDPEYGLSEAVTVDPSDPMSKKVFKMYVRGFTIVGESKEQIWKPIGFGKGSSKKRGEQEAAMNALIYYGEIKQLADDEEIYEPIN